MNEQIYGIIWLIVMLIIVGIILQNAVIGVKNNAIEAKSSIETVLQNRHDLIPNLVELVKRYMAHETDTLQKIVSLRNSWTTLTSENIQNESMLSSSLKNVFALAENYPELKASQNFLDLQNKWNWIEDRLQAARRSYNAAVKDLKNKKEMFPWSLFASSINMSEFPMFEASQEARETPDAKKLLA